MSEQNILNPSVTSLLNPDYGYRETRTPVIARFMARGGKPQSRRVAVAGRVFELGWNGALLTTKLALEQWANQYEQDFFTYADWERGRYYSGYFDGDPEFTPAGNDKWAMKARFVELAGVALYGYPANWGVDSVFRYAKDGFAGNIVNVTGTWAYAANANAKGASDYTSSTNNDTAEWLYFGYGFRLWSRKGPNLGIVEVSCSDNKGNVELAATNVDLYAAGATASAALQTVAALNLGEHRVKLRCTNTKNGASSAVTITADAIEVMR